MDASENKPKFPEKEILHYDRLSEEMGKVKKIKPEGCPLLQTGAFGGGKPMKPGKRD